MRNISYLCLLGSMAMGLHAAEQVPVAPANPAGPDATAATASTAKPVKPAMPDMSDFAKEPSTFCRYVPERADDFAWENDRVAFRAYGPALRARKVEDSGIDCWPKRVEYPIINRWYAGMQKGLSYHDDRGEGGDQYHVGSSRGCGGTALWINDKMVTPGPYVAWHVEECGKTRSAFTLTYHYPASAGEDPVVESKAFEIRLGEDWFSSTSTFTRGGRPLANLPVAVGVTTHDGKGTISKDPAGRWVSVWEEIKNTGFLGTGIAVPEGAVLKEINSPKPADSSHALAILTTDAEGRVRFRAGFALVKAGRITTLEAWQLRLAQAATGL